MLPFETHRIFEEARACYINGHFAATIILATAFVEHLLAARLGAWGFDKQVARGLAACVEVARKEKLINKVILDKVDRLRLNRNPFAHLKPFDYKHSPVARAVRTNMNPHAIVESDAQDALRVMYAVGVFAFKRT